ncbi:MAG TPA: BA14K family protein [Afifellaceae bacterium]|nr:BA14K family protein [Afifellaceae bacterium]
MVRTDRHFQAARRDDADPNSHRNDETPLNSDRTEETFDGLIADLTHGLNDELARSARRAVPFFDDLHSEDAAVRSMATRLAPNQKPRVKVRRPRYRRPSQDRWRLTDEQAGWDERNDAHHAERRDRSRSIEGPRGRRTVWGVSAGIVIVASISAAFAFVRPWNDVLPDRPDNISGERVTVAADRGDAAGSQLAGDVVGSNPMPSASDTPSAAAGNTLMPAIPVSPAEAAPAIKPSVAQADPASRDQADLLAAAGGRALDTGATGRQSDTADVAAGEAATGQSPEAVPEKSEDRLPDPILRSAQADPTPATGATASVEVPVSNEALTVELPLPAAQVDRLLARGEDLLQSGDMVSARMIFLRIVAAGDRRGAMGVGMTYDPDVYARLAVAGLTPDRDKADSWYDRAGDVPRFTITRRSRPETPELREAGSTAPDAGAAKSDAVAAAEPYAGSPERNAACAKKYKSFDANTGLYKSLSGVMRPCRLP